jgi:predicted unusual protein kinase regulating ubiquinone biosynthesis (AarF/ABC1/UbiB family)
MPSFLYRMKEKCISLAITHLTKHNVLFVKLFQALSSNNFVSNETLQIFKSFTNSAKFYENEVDYELLDKVVDQYKITLYDTKPINAGMISVVFKGRMDDKDVVIKMKRIDIYNRLQWGYREFGNLYKIVFYILRLFGKHDLLNTIASFVESEDYILTQCEFKDEIYAMETMRKELEEYTEIGTITHIDKLVVPRVYNEADETEYIIMEFLEGQSVFELNEDEKIEYLEIIVVMTSFPLISTIQHTDLHPGNVICMNMNGVKKAGMIDFGMFVVNKPKIQKALFNLSELCVNKRDLSYNYMQHFGIMVEPELDWKKMNNSQYTQLNAMAKQLIEDMIAGHLTENHIREMFEKVKKCLSDQVFRINIDMVKILLGNTMVCATAFALTNDFNVIGKFQERTFKEIVS